MTSLQLILLALAIAFELGDWLQTRYIAAHPVQWRELNPILGDHPDPGKVNAYFALCLALGGLLVYVLPGDLKTGVLLLAVVVEGIMVIRNMRLGIKFR